MVRWMIGPFFLFLFLAPGCSDEGANTARNQVVLRVDGQELTLQEFEKLFEPLKMNFESDDAVSLREARLQFLFQLLEEMVILRRAEELGLRIDPQELAQALSELEKDYTEGSFQDIFMTQAVSPEAWKRRLEKQMLVEKVIQQELKDSITVTPEEIQQYYEDHQDAWDEEEQVRVRQILVATNEEAAQVLNRLRDGDDFAQLAVEYSTAPEAKEGGDMGYVVRGELPESMEAAVFALKKDEVSAVIKSPFGYHIFKAEDRREPARPTMDDLIDEIREQVKKDRAETAYGPWLSDLRARYKVTVNEQIF